MSQPSQEQPQERTLGRKLVAWWVLVGTLILIGFLSAASAEDDADRSNAVYEYQFGIGGLFIYGSFVCESLIDGLLLDGSFVCSDWRGLGHLSGGLLLIP